MWSSLYPEFRSFQFLGEKGEGMYALMLQADNLAEAADMLTSRGLSVSENGGALEIDSNDTFGAAVKRRA